MRILLFKITIPITTALIIVLMGITPAHAITLNFNWNGNNNYSAIGSFSYDENTAPASFSEKAAGQTYILQSLNVSFFDPLKNVIATYNNVVDGVSIPKYFQFNFNTVTQEIFGLIDLGGEVAGETYLKGTVNTDLSLFQVPQSDSDITIDSNSGAITVKPIS
ncbi:hypothetical protein HW132_07415 [Brasilonema sp. CT11]|nr:hypothetical protein [Brasilonema sp. CT11]